MEVYHIMWIVLLVYGLSIWRMYVNLGDNSREETMIDKIAVLPVLGTIFLVLGIIVIILAPYNWWKRPKNHLNSFTTDGCSGGMSLLWKFFTGKLPPWEGCCEDHDRPYHLGGTRAERKKADEDLRECVTKGGYPRIAKVMYYFVRVGGYPLLPFPWRWGYGYKWFRPYTDSEWSNPLRYAFLPTHITNDRNIYIRKRLFHSGYVLLRSEPNDGCHTNTYVFIGYVETIKQAEKYKDNPNAR